MVYHIIDFFRSGIQIYSVFQGNLYILNHFLVHLADGYRRIVRLKVSDLIDRYRHSGRSSHHDILQTFHRIGILV